MIAACHGILHRASSSSSVAEVHWSKGSCPQEDVRQTCFASGLSGLSRRPPVRLSFSYRRSQGMVVTMTARYDNPLSCIVRVCVCVVCVSRFGCKALCSAFSISLCSVSGEGETQNRASVCLLTQCFKHSLSAPEQPCGVRVFSYLRINRVNIVSDTSNHKSEGKAKNSDQPLFAHPYALYSPSLNCWEVGGCCCCVFCLRQPV